MARRVLSARRSDIVARYRAGEKVASIAADHAISPATVVSIAREAGHVTRRNACPVAEALRRLAGATLEIRFTPDKPGPHWTANEAALRAAGRMEARS